SVYVQRAEYWAARAIEGTGDAADASARYVALVNAGPPGEFTAESAFRAGYVLFAAGEPGAAVAAWQKVSATQDARLLYWNGRAEALAGNVSAAARSYTQAEAADSLGFYGQPAARMLGTQAAPDVTYKAR